jgi:hypothetical protein
MFDSIKQVLKKTLPPEVIKYQRDRRARRSWEKDGRRAPPPHVVKETVVREYAQQFNTRILIETGTYLGDMVYAMRKAFAKIISFELDEELSRQARQKFAHNKHIQIVQGDSGELLGGHLQTIHEPCLFWLDGHFSGGITAQATLNTPIKNELEAILSHPVPGHVILIDDARCFTGEDDYPTTEELEEVVRRLKPDWEVSVKDDIIRIHA